jgi:hypothetical protein
LFVNTHETFWPEVRQRFQQNTAYDREHDGGRPDTERNCQQRDSGKPWLSPKRAERILSILPDIV